MDDAVSHLTLAAAGISTSNRRSIRVAPDQALNILAAVALSGSASVVIAMENDESTTKESSWRLSHPQGATIRKFQAMSSDDRNCQIALELFRSRCRVKRRQP